MPAAPTIAAWFRENVSNLVLVGPDEESAQWVSDIAARFGCPWQVFRNRRDGDRAVRIEAEALDIHAGQNPVLVDDIVSSGTTLVNVVRIIAERSSVVPVCVVVHGLFAGDALAAIRDAGAARVAACSTVPHRAKLIDLAGELAQALQSLLGHRV